MTPLRLTGFADPGWEHGVAQDEKKKKVKCNYCGKIVSGGIYRLKQHLARISGEVTYCKKAPEEVCLKMKENLDGYRSSKRQRQPNNEYSFNLQSCDDNEEEEPVGFKMKGKQVADDQSMIANLAPLRSLGFVDPGWEHGMAQDEKKKKVKCNYCQKVVSGGINRFKQHLARIPGEVAYCKMAPEEVYLKMKENMKWHRTGRRQRPEGKELTVFLRQLENDGRDDDNEVELVDGKNKARRLVGDNDISCGKDGRRRPRGRPPIDATSGTELKMRQIGVDTGFAKTEKSYIPQPCKQSKVKVGNHSKARKEVIASICKFFCYAAIPFNVANSPYFHKMLDLVGQYGKGLQCPSSGTISGRFLHDEVLNIENYLIEVKASWTVTGCSIMADSWKDVQGKTLINFLVSCPRGMHFITSIDASDIIHDETNLFNLLDKVVENIGEDNVVQVITENTPCYKAAGKMLEEKRRSLFWTPCAVYCIEQILEDFIKVKWVGECIARCQRITRFIYNQAWLLNLMKREFTSGMELLKPAATKFTACFLTLQNMLEHRDALKRMFQSNKWTSSQLAESDEGKGVAKLVLNSRFWKNMQFVNKSVAPVLNLLTKVDENELMSMPSIYNDMYRAKLAIKAIHGDDECKYGPFWSVIDDHCKSLFHHPLYVAAYFLNPSYRYRPDFMVLPEVTRGLNECITRLESDNRRRVSAAAQISEFVFAKADFGTELALSTRMELDPAAWWQQHGINCLELQRIAIRILSQTCSSLGCEHNWSRFDHVYSAKANRLNQKRVNDLTYVHYNLRLRERQLTRITSGCTSFDSMLFENLLRDWVVEIEKSTRQQEHADILGNVMERAEDYEDEVHENEDLVADSTDNVTSPDIVAQLQFRPSIAGAANDGDDGDPDFLGDELSD